MQKPLRHPLVVVLVLICLSMTAGRSFARGGGGCFLPGTLIATPRGPVPIETLRPGDALTAFLPDGTIVPANLRNVISHSAREYLVIRTAHASLLVTAEHPFLVGTGAYRAAGLLKPGDQLHVHDGWSWSEGSVRSVDVVEGPVTVYDLQADPPHTFFANGVAVHNKGGGGGCFPAGTMVMTPSGPAPIEGIAAGDVVIAVDGKGRKAAAKVEEAYATTSELVRVTTRHGELYATEEHPLLHESGEFIEAGDILAGDRVMVWRKGMLKRAVVLRRDLLDGEEPVYNLTVDGPHTFVADGFVVHNKGGGGGGSHGGSYRSSGSRGSGTPADPGDVLVGLCIMGTIVLVFVALAKRGVRDANLDQLYSRGDIEKKSAKTLKLLEFLSRQDQAVSPAALTKVATETFLQLQQCWEARDYGPMKPLLMPDLYADHLRQIEGMRRNHEINIIAGLHIDAVDLVNIRYPLNKAEREFTALVTATAQDYYVDDRTEAKRRGDDAPAQFQELWTFQFQGGAWLLRELEQTAESDILKDENYFEQFTDKAVDQVYGETAGAEGPAGPWTEGAPLAKEQRIERLLDHLVRTDRLWARNRMLQTARSAFIAVTRSWESGMLADDVKGRLYPEVAAHLAEAIGKNNAAGIALEFRNLAVRKVELVLVKNFANNANDEFLVRVRAHAQKAMKRGGNVVQQDADVAVFEEYLTFGRLDDDWKLKEIVAPEEGRELVAVENVDEGSSPRMIAWYYQHKRAL